MTEDHNEESQAKERDELRESRLKEIREPLVEEERELRQDHETLMRTLHGLRAELARLEAGPHVQVRLSIALELAKNTRPVPYDAQIEARVGDAIAWLHRHTGRSEDEILHALHYDPELWDEIDGEVECTAPEHEKVCTACFPDWPVDDDTWS